MEGLAFVQSPVLINFVYPFFLIFFVIFAVLEKTKIFGDGRKQINALVAFIIGFIFISAVFPKEMVSNLMLFLAVAVVVVLVVLLLWGFVAGEDGLKFGSFPKGLKVAIGVVIVLAVIVAIFWSSGLDTKGFLDEIFHSSWSGALWTNVFFVVAVAGALAVVLGTGKKS